MSATPPQTQAIADLAMQALREKKLRTYSLLGLGPSFALKQEAPVREALAALSNAAWNIEAGTENELATVQQVSPVNMNVSSLSLEALEHQVAQCQACSLCKTRTQTVFSSGSSTASLAIVGEAPGAEEDRTGLAFVGNAGKLLDAMLASLSMTRERDAYICNVLKCRPPNNRDPEPQEVAKCEPFLQQQLTLVQPKLILVLGRFAAQSLLKTDASIASLRGRVHSYQVGTQQVPVVVTYHPAYLLRNLGDKAKSWVDLCLAKAELTRLQN